MQRAFARALRRSGLPVAYSEGYNPHIVMSFASPLSVGFATEGDYLEVKMAEDVEPGYIKDRLAAVMPEGISINPTLYVFFVVLVISFIFSYTRKRKKR